MGGRGARGRGAGGQKARGAGGQRSRGARVRKAGAGGRQAGRQPGTSPAAARHLSSTSGPNRRILIVIPDRICTQICRTGRQPGSQAPLQNQPGTSPEPGRHLSDTRQAPLQHRPPRGEVAKLVILGGLRAQIPIGISFF